MDGKRFFKTGAFTDEMKIISFDSECTRDFVMHCEMCLFGYAVANTNFGIELNRQIYIKASKPTGRAKKFISADYEKVKTAPEYREIRSQIASVFDWPDGVYIAHSPESTFRYLCCMDRIAGSNKPIRCKAYDIFTLVRNYADLPSYGLASIAKTFNIPYNRKEPNSDAKTCIKILEYICKEEKITFEKLLEICGNGAIVDSEVVYHNTMKKFKQEKLNKIYDSPHKEGKFNGIVFSLSESFENNRLELGLRIAEYIVENGGKITKKSSESNIFVWDGDLESKRLESVNSVQGDTIKVITPDELFSMNN